MDKFKRGMRVAMRDVWDNITPGTVIGMGMFPMTNMKGMIYAWAHTTHVRFDDGEHSEGTFSAVFTSDLFPA